MAVEQTGREALAETRRLLGILRSDMTEAELEPQPGMGGLDTLVFTAGVGENASPIRARIMEQCAWLGVRLDEAANTSGARRIR